MDTQDIDFIDADGNSLKRSALCEFIVALREENARLKDEAMNERVKAALYKRERDEARAELGATRDEARRLSCAVARMEHVEGAMRADDKRLEDAAVKVWGEHRWGCDTPDQMADLILSLRQRVEELERQRIEGVVALCVCENAATPRPGCDCVTCTVRRADQRAEAAEARLAKVVEALRAEIPDDGPSSKPEDGAVWPAWKRAQREEGR